MGSYKCTVVLHSGFHRGSVVNNPPASAGDSGLIPGSGRSLEEKMATGSSILAWIIKWTEEPGYNPWGHKELNTTEWLTQHDNSMIKRVHPKHVHSKSKFI